MVDGSPSNETGEAMTASEIELARRAGFVEGLRDAADEVGSWGPTKVHIAALLRAKADRAEQFNKARASAPESSDV